MSAAAAAPIPSVPYQGRERFSSRRWFKAHRPEGVSRYSPLPVECWIVQRNRSWNNYILSKTQDHFVRVLMRLVPEADRDGKSGKPMVTSAIGYMQLAQLTHTSKSTAYRTMRALHRKHVAVAWDVTNGRIAKRSGHEGGRRKTRYLLRPFRQVLEMLQGDAEVGKIGDPTNGNAQHFFKIGRAARLLSQDQIEAWDCAGYMCEKARLSRKDLAGADEGGQLAIAPAAGELVDLFRSVRGWGLTAREEDVSHLVAAAAAAAGGQLSRDEIAWLLQQAAVANRNKPFPNRGLLEKILVDKATGYGQRRNREAQAQDEQADRDQKALLDTVVGHWITVLDKVSPTPLEEITWAREELRAYNSDLVARGKAIAQQRLYPQRE